jgi:hypothetical protein
VLTKSCSSIDLAGPRTLRGISVNISVISCGSDSLPCHIGISPSFFRIVILLRGWELRPTCKIMHLVNLQLLGVSDYIFFLRFFSGSRRVVSRGSITTSLGIDLVLVGVPRYSQVSLLLLPVKWPNFSSLACTVHYPAYN